MTTERSYYRIMLGRGSMHANECHDGEFIGAHFGFDDSLSNDLPENWREFNAKFRPIFLERHPDKSKITAGLACGAVWTICKGIKQGDIVLCPNGSGQYWVGEVVSDYYFEKNADFLPQRRKVKWYEAVIERSGMSDSLRNSSGSIGTVSNVTKYAEEIELLIAGKRPHQLISTDELVEDPSVFALEKHLEDFLVQNWSQTVLGENYNIVEDEGEIVGQQFPSDTGPIDILAISKDQKEYLVVELKKGRASDAVVGQVQRYMGYVLDDLANDDQKVRGVIIALEDDLRLKRALQVTTNIEFYRYQVSFKLFKD